MELHELISLLTRARLCIPDTCTSIRSEIQDKIDLLKQTTRFGQYVETVEIPKETEIVVLEDSVQNSES